MKQKISAEPLFYLVVGSKTECRFFICEALLKQGIAFDFSIEQKERLLNPMGRKSTKQNNSDRPGRSFDSMGKGRHALSPTIDPEEQNLIRFSKQISDHLESAFEHHHYQGLILIFGPQLLGLLRNALPTKLKHLIFEEFPKNLERFDESEIKSFLADHIRGLPLALTKTSHSA